MRKRCQWEDNDTTCTTYALGPGNKRPALFCIRHGGGVRCQIEDCESAVQRGCVNKDMHMTNLIKKFFSYPTHVEKRSFLHLGNLKKIFKYSSFFFLKFSFDFFLLFVTLFKFPSPPSAVKTEEGNAVVFGKLGKLGKLIKNGRHKQWFMGGQRRQDDAFVHQPLVVGTEHQTCVLT